MWGKTVLGGKTWGGGEKKLPLQKAGGGNPVVSTKGLVPDNL